MAQLTIRLSDAQADRVRRHAATAGRSVNEFVTAVLAAATDPDLAGTEAERTRERLARSGILADLPRRDGRRPAAAEVEAARRRAARGTALSHIVSDGRG